MNNLTEIDTTYSNEKQNIFARIKNFFARYKFKLAITNALGSLKNEVDDRYTSVPKLQNQTEQTEKINNELIEEIGNLFNHQSPGSYLMSIKGADENKTIRLREEKLKELVKIFNDKYQIDGFKIVFNYDQVSACGSYRYGKKTLYINSCYLLIDNEFVLNEAVDTVIHEFRHAVQYDTIRNDKMAERLGFDDKTRKLWTDNVINYIRPQKDPVGYENQPIEVDARNYAEYIIASCLKRANQERKV